jgi:hypothetical protein
MSDLKEEKRAAVEEWSLQPGRNQEDKTLSQRKR